MKAAERYSGRAPAIATSLMVPCTDSEPISPPGKNSGEMTWPSVVMTMRPAVNGECGLVVRLPQHSLSKSAMNKLLDQLGRRPPAGAVASIDLAVLDIEEGLCAGKIAGAIHDGSPGSGLRAGNSSIAGTEAGALQEGFAACRKRP